MANILRDDLFYFKWHINDAKTLKRQVKIGQMTLAQVGELFLLVMDYVAYANSGENYNPPEIPPALSYACSNFQVRVDDARAARISIGQSRAESGRKGGEAKAQKAKRSKEVTDFKPPTLKQFQATVAHFSNTGDIEEKVDDYEINELFELLKDADWTIGGDPIQERSDWESAIMVRFYDADSNLPKNMYYKIFECIYADFHGLRDKTGENRADSAAYDFFYEFDVGCNGWNIHGKEYPIVKWEAALSEFMNTWTEDIPP